jgi:hypothetical protein
MASTLVSTLTVPPDDRRNPLPFPVAHREDTPTRSVCPRRPTNLDELATMSHLRLAPFAVLLLTTPLRAGQADRVTPWIHDVPSRKTEDSDFSATSVTPSGT